MDTVRRWQTLLQRLFVLLHVLASDLTAMYGDFYDFSNQSQPLMIGIELHPPQINTMFVNNQMEVQINYTDHLDTQPSANLTYTALIVSNDPYVAVPLRPGETFVPDPNATTEALSLQLHPNHSSSFLVEALCVGYASMIIRVTGHVSDTADFTTEVSRSHSVLPYHVTVIRKIRLVDRVFDWTIAAIVVLNSFSIGCATDWASVRMHAKHPTSLLLAAGCQFIIMPTISLAVVKALGVSPELSLGLFYVACVPGGGLGHVMVGIVSGDRALSVAINCVTTLATIGLFPLWVFSLGRFLAGPHTDHKLYRLVACLVAHAAAHALGAALRHSCPRASEAFLNWFSKPFLLLYSLLLITLGVYINMYMFTVLRVHLMVGCAVLPVSGYLTGLFVGHISRQEAEYVKTISAECTMSNCLLVLVMVRFSLPQPDSDIASALPMWVLFTSPAPFIVSSLLKSVKRSMWKRCAKRREKKYRHFSIVSSLLNITNVTNLSSSTSPKLLSPTDEPAKNLVDEKITVL